VPAWALFVGQARAITAALSNTPDPMAARREEHLSLKIHDARRALGRIE
jgi:hypothetical protein